MGRLGMLASKNISLNEVVAWWRSKDLSTKEDYECVLDNFRVVFACNSANIEGSSISYHTTRDIFEDEEIKSFSGKATDIIEIQNQKFAFNYLIKNVAEKTPITKELILKLHKIMMTGCYNQRRYDRGERPGMYKVNDYIVGMTDEGSTPSEVDYDVEELLTEINEVSTNDIITVAAYFHLKFESIHAFADGNGRVGRTLLNYFLMLNNYPPAVLFNEDRDTYYMALEVWDRTGQLSGMKKFLEEQIIKTWAKYVKR